MKNQDTTMQLDDFLARISSHPCYATKSSLFSIVLRFCKSIPIVQLCKKLKISTSGYYSWKNRLDKENPNESIVETIREIQNQNDFTLGHRRMKTELEKEDIFISNSKTYRLMKKYGLLSKALYTKKNKIIVNTIHSYRNQLNGDFSAFMPNLKWCIDLTTIKTDEGPIYLCAVIDLYDRYIVNWKIYNVQNTKLVKTTIEEALKNENIRNDVPVLLHSDHGSQFSNSQYKKFTIQNNITPSMAVKGCPNENAVIESFFATLKLECLYRYVFETKKQAIETIREFINYYNCARIQLNSNKTPYEIRQAAA